MLVTINTDASFHPKLKFGAYAFWAISNDFKITKSGVFRKKCVNPDDAEAKCIINALTLILKAHKGITRIIINTDSLNAIAYLKADKVHVRKYGLFRSKIDQFNPIFKKLKRGIDIEFRHVKAHSGVSDRRSYVNEWCDSEAKSQLRKKILKVKENEKRN